MFGERNDIFGTLAQRRNAKLKLSETMKEILAEAAFAHRGFEILVGGGNDADIHLDLAMPAETVEGLAIEHAQQLDLRLQLQFADFVEEERALVGQFEESGLGSVSAAERAFFVSEQFALHQIFGKRGAVDVDPRTAAAMRRLMNRASDEFLAGTGLAGDQNGFRVAGDAIHQCHELVHDRAGQNELRVVDLAETHAVRGATCGAECTDGSDARLHQPALPPRSVPIGFRMPNPEAAWPKTAPGKLLPVLG